MNTWCAVAVSGWLCFGVAVPARCATEFAATSGVIAAPFVSGEDGSVFQPNLTAATNGGRAVYRFTITNAGDYTLYALVHAPSHKGNSVCLDVNAEPQDPAMTWHIPVRVPASNKPDWMKARGPGGDRVFRLEAGTHTLIVRGMGPNLRLMRFRLERKGEEPRAPGDARAAK